MNKKSFFGKLLLLATTIIWGSSFIVLKDTLEKIGGGNFTFFTLASRFVIAAALLAVLGAKRFKKMTKKTLIKGLFLGIVLAFAYGVQTLGLKYTTASKNAFLTATYCVIVPFLAWLFVGKKPNAFNVAATFLCLLGIAFIAVIGKKEVAGDTETLGNVLSVGCGLFYALQIVFIDKYVSEEDPVCLLFVEISAVAVIFTAITCVYEFPLYGSEFSIGFDAVRKILYLAFFATCFAQFGQMIGQKWTNPTVTSLILSLESVFGVFFDVLVGGRTLEVYIIIGFAIVFIAELMNELGPKLFLKNYKDNENSEIG